MKFKFKVTGWKAISSYINLTPPLASGWRRPWFYINHIQSIRIFSLENVNSIFLTDNEKNKKRRKYKIDEQI